MKQLKYIFLSLVLLVPVLANAQKVSLNAQVADPPLFSDYKLGNGTNRSGIATGKSVTGPVNDLYTLKLETFATGITSIVDLSKPADIVLVLDVSGSMVYPMTYKKTTLSSLSYNNVKDIQTYADLQYWYLADDGNYYVIYREYDYYYGRYYLYYLDSNDSRHNLAQGNRAGSTTMETSRVYECDKSRLDVLKDAVTAFIAEIKDNAIYTVNASGQKEERETHLDNRISVVKFASGYYNNNTTSIAAGNHQGYTEVVVPFSNVETGNFSDIGNLVASGVTSSDYGMTKARYLFQNLYNQFPTRESNRTVVMFTDGSPTHNGQNTDFGTVADATISVSNYLKVNYNASVFTVGVFDSVTSDITNYMQRTSSLYTGATSRTTGSLVDTDIEYYQDASDPDSDLKAIFEDIAKASGGSESSIPAETMLVDAVSNSFEVPSTFKAQDVVVYTLNALSDGTGFDENSREDLDKVILPEDYDLEKLPPEDAPYMTDEGKVGVYLKDGKLMVLGFNYSKPDTEGVTPYDGNWVGWRGNGVDCAGKELVIEFNIEAKDGVTGGDGTNTNDITSSGVYIPIYDQNGKFLGYQNVNGYPYPQTDLPINIVIQKEGLRRGESATIQIYRAPANLNEFDPNTGKPIPDTSKGWENFTKVILTNTSGSDGETVEKTLLCLDPSYVYRLVEDNWGWGYHLDETDITTSSQVKNPFVFVNRLDTDAVKHAEAVSINIFGDNYGQKSYKGSKVQSY